MRTSRSKFCFVGLAGILALVPSGCNRQQTPKNTVRATTPIIPVKFTDVTRAAGIRFIHNNGASGLMLMPETNGSGVAFLDYDGDGYQDLFFVNGRDWTVAEVRAAQAHLPATSALRDQKFAPHRPKALPGALYHNNRNGTFTDMTIGSGLDVVMLGMGAAVGDYDNDGRPDLFVTGYARTYLFHNAGSGKFREVTAQAGVQDNKWSSSAAWLDYDKDGWLDLFVSRYIPWMPATDVYQTLKNHKNYSNPTAYDGQSSRLFRNLGGGKFRDVSAVAGITERAAASGQSEKLDGKGMGVAVCDYNNDGWPDIAVANDTQRNYLFENKGDGTFNEVATQTGLALSQLGRPRAGMGIDTADIDHSNHDSVLIGNFSQEMLGLYYNDQSHAFVDMAPTSEIGAASRAFLTFGCLFFDFDNDGWSDIVAANGHVYPSATQTLDEMGYRQRPLLFRNQTADQKTRAGAPRFREIGRQSGAGLSQAIVGRGLAYADIDLDGDLDLVFSSNGGAPLLLRNDGGNKNNAVRLTLQGSKSNRSGIGALIKVKTGDSVQRLWARSGSSYLSQSELPLTIGLGRQSAAEGIAILWPSGAKTKLGNVRANQMIVVNEAKGIVSQQPFPRR